jgi:hypothetical protein
MFGASRKFHLTYSVGGLILNNSGAITANYWLTELYDEELQKPIAKQTFIFMIFRC